MGLNRKIISAAVSIVPFVYEQDKESRDEKLRKIYESYHYGRPITLDDLRYLWTKDPEGCEKLTKNLVEPTKDPHRVETEQNAIAWIERIEHELCQTRKTLSVRMTPAEEASAAALKNVTDSLENVKQMVTAMSQEELGDLVTNLYEASELRKEYENEVEGWENFLTDTIVYASYSEPDFFDAQHDFKA